MSLREDKMYDYERLRKSIARSVSDILDIDVTEVTIEEADKTKIYADLALPCFRFAQQLKATPQEIASTLAEKLNVPEAASIEAVSGYLNIKLQASYLARTLLLDTQLHKTYGFITQDVPETVVVDFIGLNLAKPFSVGHLRPTVQGWALINLYRALGYNVIGDNHLGDWGTPFGMWAVAFTLWGDEAKLTEDGVYELGRLYVQFRKESKDKPELLSEAKVWLKKLEVKDLEAVALQERFSAISVAHMYQVLQRIDITPDENIGESFYIPKVEAFLADLIARGLAIEQDDGTIISKLDDYGIDTPILLRKSDGSYLYASTDILTIDYRIERWKPKKIIYSVGQEQQFHFKQVFALADKLGYDVELEHAWFGLIEEADEDGNRRKMSSRSGISYLEQLLDLAETKARSMLSDDSEVSDNDIRLIANAAIKFSDLSQSRKLNILFDWDTMFSLNGYSGPYLQYAAVRAKAILQKIEPAKTFSEVNAEGYDWEAERTLLWLAYRYPRELETATSQNEPFIIAAYCFELAKELNRYYEKHQILKSDPGIQQRRLWTIGLIENILTSGLGILGIYVPERM
jgi:arginyl-tRNA synthetase